MLHTRFLDRHPRIYYSVMVSLFLLGPVLILIGGCREPLFSSDERMLFVPGEYELKLDRPWHYALFHEEQAQDQKALERIWDSGEIRYPDGVSVQIRGKESGPIALPVGIIRGWKPDDGGSAIVDAFEIPFKRADTYLISIRREGGPPRFATRIYLQRRISLGTGRAIAGLGAGGMLASILLALGSRKSYPRRNALEEPLPPPVSPPPQEAAAQPCKGLAVSNPVTLYRELEEAPDRIVFAPKRSAWAWAIVLTLGVAFAGGGSMKLLDAAEHTPAKQAPRRVGLPPGCRLAHPDSELSDWAFGSGFVLLGGLLVLAGLYMAWTFHSLIVNPEKRELVRKIALRWPAWTWTWSWLASDIESIYLDEHVTVWPGTPQWLRSIGNVEARETSEGHVWIRFRNGKSADCGKGAWEEAAALASRVAGLLGAPKTLRERFEVGPPPSNDTSS